MTDIRAVCWEAISCLSGRAKGCGNVCKKVFGKPELQKRNLLMAISSFRNFSILFLYFTRGHMKITQKTKQVPLQSAFLFSAVNSKRKCLRQPSRNKYNKRIPYNLRQISRMDLKRENASDQVEVRCGFTSIFRRGWCAISGYCRHPLDYCFIRTAPCY